MQTRLIVFFFLITNLTTTGFAQVDEIKSASRNSTKGNSDSNYGGGGGTFFFDLFFNVFIGEVIRAQQEKLSHRDEVPGMVSMDVLLQSAAQPSSYYILNPRVRLNWALFSSDFRLNYIMEEGIEGMKHLRTNEWQILQFNIITTKDLSLRVGGGFIEEAYGDRNYYGEWTTALGVHPSMSRFGGFFEYRDADMRKEVNSYAMFKLFDRGKFHGTLTAGVIAQRYYRTVTAWGLQTGIILRLY